MDQVQHQQKNTSFELEWLERTFHLFWLAYFQASVYMQAFFRKKRELKEIVLKLAYSRDSRRRGFSPSVCCVERISKRSIL